MTTFPRFCNPRTMTPVEIARRLTQILEDRRLVAEWDELYRKWNCLPSTVRREALLSCHSDRESALREAKRKAEEK